MTLSQTSRHKREVSSTFDLSIDVSLRRRCCAKRAATRVILSISITV